MQLKCDVCDNLTSNPLVDKDENGLPIIVCQRCFGRVRAMREYLKQPSVPMYYAKPNTKSNGNRYATITSQKHSTKWVHKLEMYEDNNLVETMFFDTASIAAQRQQQFINNIPLSLIPFKRYQSYRIPKGYAKGHHAKIEYIRKYNRQKYKQFNLQLNREKDVDFIVDIENAKSKAEFFRQLYAFWVMNGGKNEYQEQSVKRI